MDGNISKSHLKKSHPKNIGMYVEHVENDCRRSQMKFTWNLPGFFKREKFALYTKSFDILGFDLQLKKEKDSFVVTVDIKASEMFIGISCSVFCDDTCFLTPVDARQVSKNSYQVKFSPNDFMFLKNSALNRTDAIKLQFKMTTKEEYFNHLGTSTKDYSRFKEFDAFIVLDRLLIDFKIHSNDGSSIPCHKSLLATRSKFFLSYFSEPSNDKNEIRLHSSFQSLVPVVLYLYDNGLHVKELQVMLDIVKLAWELDIPSLKSRVDRYIEPFLNSSTVHQIREVGIKTGLTNLVKVADNFLANMHRIEMKETINSREKI